MFHDIMNFFTTLLLGLVMPLMLLGAEPTDTITVFMIGDSTMANKPLDKENQERGWGQMLPLMLQGAIKVDNHALNGYSGKSFIDNGKWDKVLSLIKPGDYVIIQFGHNDQKPDPKRHGDAGGSYDDNLRKFVSEARQKGAKPILCNSIVRRNFPLDSTDVHVDRDDAPLQGFENLKDKLKPEGKYEFCPKGKIDNTHLNIYGGTVVAGIAARAIAEAVPELRPYIKADYIVTYPTF